MTGTRQKETLIKLTKEQVKEGLDDMNVFQVTEQLARLECFIRPLKGRQEKYSLVHTFQSNSGRIALLIYVIILCRTEFVESEISLETDCVNIWTN